MRSVFAFAIALTLGAAFPALAQDAPPTEEIKPQPEEQVGSRLDKLFGDLKRQRNEKAAERIAGNIWQEWFKSGSASVDLMMKWAGDAVEAKKYDVALDFLDQVIILAPTYPEGWNRRATVHFMMQNFGKSMADIERTLELEPRHFGALSGMAEIMKTTGRKELALDAYQRVLAIYPMMRSAQNEVSELSEELAGEGI
jgi:tetratricopeptide (TPR) repeat protein